MQNKTYEIIPYNSIGNIYFSDRREMVREKIGGKYIYGVNEFKNIVELYDFFPDQDIKVAYDKNECLGSIEFFKGTVFFLGMNVMSMPYLEVKRIIRSLDPDLDINEDGFTSYKYGVGVAWDEEDNIITSVIAFKKDYYN